jgi:hypothetical protein
MMYNRVMKNIDERFCNTFLILYVSFATGVSILKLLNCIIFALYENFSICYCFSNVQGYTVILFRLDIFYQNLRKPRNF